MPYNFFFWFNFAPPNACLFIYLSIIIIIILVGLEYNQLLHKPPGHKDPNILGFRIISDPNI
jgi:hypothetical protein